MLNRIFRYNISLIHFHSFDPVDLGSIQFLVTLYQKYEHVLGQIIDDYDYIMNTINIEQVLRTHDDKMCCFHSFSSILP